MQYFFTYNELENLLGVEAPLLMLDHLSLDVDQEKALGIKMVSMNELFFAGHFPEHPVMPGVLQVAAMTQAAKAIMLKCRPQEGEATVIGLSKVKFRKPVLPGMVLKVEAALLSENEDGSLDFQIRNSADDELTSSGVVSMAWKTADWFQQRPPKGAPSPCQSQMQEDFADIKTIMKYLPHRLPFLLLDRSFAIGKGEQAVGYKNITGNDLLCRSEKRAYFPGYLQIEAGAQLGCAHILSQPEHAGKIGLFMSIDQATFHAPVFPGEQLVLSIVTSFGGRFGIGEGKCYVEDRLVSETAIKFAVLPIQ
jgi:3-hydroxymyristoyl/3-hydroxydecanoyl-(acyl carrier protein) dehydratase